MLVMLRQPVAQGLMYKLGDLSGDHPHVRVFHELDYANAEYTANSNTADVALIEAAETGEYDVFYCLALCARLRASACKLLLLCPEQDEASVSAAVEAKQNDLIEDFVFYDASIDYLISKLLSI